MNELKWSLHYDKIYLMTWHRHTTSRPIDAFSVFATEQENLQTIFLSLEKNRGNVKSDTVYQIPWKRRN